MHQTYIRFQLLGENNRSDWSQRPFPYMGGRRNDSFC